MSEAGSFPAPLRAQRAGWLAAFCVLLGAYAVLGSTTLAVGLFTPPWDKAAHFALFGSLAFLLSMSTHHQRPFGVVLAITVLGLADEWHQRFLHGRDAAISDWLTDVAAALIIVIVVTVVVKVIRRSTRSKEGTLS